MGQGGHKDSVDVKCVHIYYCYYVTAVHDGIWHVILQVS